MIIVTDETFIERKGTERYFNGKVKKKSRKWYLKYLYFLEIHGRVSIKIAFAPILA